MNFEEFVAAVVPSQKRLALLLGEAHLAPLLSAFNRRAAELPEGADVQIQCGVQDRTPEGLEPDHDLLASILIVEANEGRVLWSGSILIGMSPTIVEEGE